MKQLKKIIKKRSVFAVASRPDIFNLGETKHRRKLDQLMKLNSSLQVIDDYEEQLLEFFLISNPLLAHDAGLKNKFGIYLKNLTSRAPLWKQGRWVHFSWLHTLVHILEEKDFFAVRTARNKLLITQSEQEKFYKAKIGIGGLSIGNSVAIALVLQGGAKHIRLADFDRLALSNTNRILAGVQNLGLLKVDVTARQIYEINPYAQVEIFNEGINEKNVKKFTNGLDILVDEMDSLAIKLLLRKEARKQKIPIVMGADNGDSAIVDIERHDKKSKVAFFHGRLGNITYEQLKKLNKFETGKTIAQLIGLENHTGRMLNSLQEMGKSIVSWPQLGGTALINGSAVAFCVRKIITHQPLKNNRAIISLEQNLESDYFSKAQKQKRAKSIKAFKKIFNL